MSKENSVVRDLVSKRLRIGSYRKVLSRWRIELPPHSLRTLASDQSIGIRLKQCDSCISLC